MTDTYLQEDETVFNAEEIRRFSDRCLFMNEFAVAYDEPVDPLYEWEEGRDERGYLMAFVRDTGPGASYERLQFMSGDDRMIRRYFAEMASDGPSRIEEFIG